MSSSDLYVDGFPHGTAQGYDDGCRGGACPTGVAYGLSCKVAKAKSRGDFQYQKLVRSGASIPAIAEALGLIGAESLPVPTKKRTTKAKPAAPTPATAKGGRSFTEAAAANTDAMETLHADALSRIAAAAEPIAQAETTGGGEAVDRDPEPTGVPATAAPGPDETPDQNASRDPAPAAPMPRTGEIRAWARQRGYEVGAKGKLPQYIIEHYWQVTGRLSAAPEDTGPDKRQPELATPAPAEDSAAAEVDTAHAPDVAKTFVEISIDVPDVLLPEPRGDWGTIAESVDVERARSLAVRLEQELAHTSDLLEQERTAGTDLARDYLNEVGKTIALEEHIASLRNRLADEKKLRIIAERAASFALTKWGEQRADNEAAHALIIGQAHTINQLTALLEPPRWMIPDDAAIADLVAQQRSEVMNPAEARIAIWRH